MSRKSNPKTISVYFNAALHDEIKKRAKQLDMSVSQYLRRLAREDMGRK